MNNAHHLKGLQDLLQHNRKDMTGVVNQLGRQLSTNEGYVGEVLKLIRDPKVLEQLYDDGYLKHRDLYNDAFHEEASGVPFRTDKKYNTEPLTCMEITGALGIGPRTPIDLRKIIESFASVETLMNEILAWMNDPQYAKKISGKDVRDCCARHGLLPEEVYSFFEGKVDKGMFVAITADS